MANQLVDRFALRAHVTAIERAAERSWLIRAAGPALGSPGKRGME